jgi:hypothetical protein
LTLPLGWLVCEQAKANVCNVRWHFFVGGLFFNKIILCVSHSKRCRLLSQVIPKMFVQSTKVSSLQGANTVAANGLRLGEGGDFTTELSYEAHTSNLR